MTGMRRSILIGAAGFIAGAAAATYAARSRLVSDLALMASPSPKVDGIIDTHHHMIPPFYREVMASSIASVMPNGKVPDWSPTTDLAVMDEYRIRKAVISVSPGIWGLSPQNTQTLARQVNEYGARLVTDHPTRYGHWAILPLPDIDASLAEVAYACDTLKADGLIIFTNYDGLYLGDPHFEPLWQELHRRKAVVFIHPTNVPYKAPVISASVMEFPFDTTRTVMSLIYSGATLRYPDIKFVCSHGGGTLPYLAGRVEAPTRMSPKIAEILPNGVLPELKKLYWDTALTYNATALRSLLALTDSSKIVFGTDVPFAPSLVIPVEQKSLKQELGDEDLTNILSKSALRLLPRLV